MVVVGSDARYEAQKHAVEQAQGLQAGAAQEEEDLPTVMKRAKQLQDKGNASYKASRFSEAIGHYRAGLQQLLVKPAAGKLDANSLSSVLWSNIAASHLQTEDFRAALDSCTAALAAQPKFVKALFRRAQAKRALGDLPGALADAEAARAEEPSNRIVVDLVYDLEDERDALRAAAGGGRAAAKQAGQGQAERQQADTEERREEAGEAEVAFAMGVIDELRTGLLCASEAPTQILLMHSSEVAAAGPGGAAAGVSVGKITIDGAFASSTALESALAYARSQHMIAAAECAVVIVPKSKVQYPLAWWAGAWPFPLEQDGVFVELHSRGAAAITWFLPEGCGIAALGEAEKLSADCGLLADMRPIFPK